MNGATSRDRKNSIAHGGTTDFGRSAVGVDLGIVGGGRDSRRGGGAGFGGAGFGGGGFRSAAFGAGGFGAAGVGGGTQLPGTGDRRRIACGTDPCGETRGDPHEAPISGIPWRGRNHRLGAFGEAEAARYLERAGYRIIERNWVCRDPDLRGELDLIARLRRTLVVFEVKTRSTNRLAHPAEAVTRAKAARLRRLAARWLADHRSRPGGQRLIRQMKDLRIDVIAIRTRPEPPFAVLELDHLVGVA